MRLTKKQLAAFQYDEWKAWVYDLKENHFFFLCPLHIIFLVREGVDGEGTVHHKHKCDYPGCLKQATVEFFPNLLVSLKQAEEDCKNNRLYEMDKKGNFKKVKNYGKRVQPEAVSKKRSKKA